jgi:hypothetical protein
VSGSHFASSQNELQVGKIKSPTSERARTTTAVPCFLSAHSLCHPPPPHSPLVCLALCLFAPSLPRLILFCRLCRACQVRRVLRTPLVSPVGGPRSLGEIRGAAAVGKASAAARKLFARPLCSLGTCGHGANAGTAHRHPRSHGHWCGASFFKEILKALLCSAGAGYEHRSPNPNGAPARGGLEKRRACPLAKPGACCSLTRGVVDDFTATRRLEFYSHSYPVQDLPLDNHPLNVPPVSMRGGLELSTETPVAMLASTVLAQVLSALWNHVTVLRSQHSHGQGVVNQRSRVAEMKVSKGKLPFLDRRAQKDSDIVKFVHFRACFSVRKHDPLTSLAHCFQKKMSSFW